MIQIERIKTIFIIVLLLKWDPIGIMVIEKELFVLLKMLIGVKSQL